MYTDHGRPDSCRRQFLLSVASIASTFLCTGVSRSAELDPAGQDVESQETVWLRASDKGLYRVRIEMEIEGNANVPKNPLVSRKSELKLPLRSQAAFDYEERYRRPEGADASDYVTMLERYYHGAENNSELNRRKQSTTLRESVRSTIVRREMLPATIYAVEDYFDRDELELLRTPVSSSAIDELLPVKAVRVGDKYSPSANIMMSVLNLSAVQSTDVTAEVVLITDSEARIQFRGDVQGSVDGVPTIVRAAGKLTFNRQQETCTWLAMAIHETREVGKAEPGFDVAGTIKMVRKPVDQPQGLAFEKPDLDINQPVPEDRLYVDLKSDQIGIRALTDRNWRMMTDVPGAAMMRMIDNDQSVAQCDFRPLATLKAGEQWTLEAFQKDIKRTLGDQLTGLVSADQQASDAGLRVMRVIARGAVENVPIQWVVLHFSDDSGRRVLATFTMEGDHVEAFAQADEQLMTSLRFIDSARRSTEVAASSDRVLEIALQPPAATSVDIQSASDLR
jgi:hypothetical protein